MAGERALLLTPKGVCIAVHAPSLLLLSLHLSICLMVSLLNSDSLFLPLPHRTSYVAFAILLRSHAHAYLCGLNERGHIITL